MRVLVLGGAGFIGRHVVAALMARGHEAIVGTRDPGRAARSPRKCVAASGGAHGSNDSPPPAAGTFCSRASKWS